MYGYRPGKVRYLFAVAALAAVVVLVGSVPARGDSAPAAGASGWGWPLTGPARALVGFGTAYGEGAQARTHSGCDLAAEAGDNVVAPVAADVTFVGLVPSGSDRRLLTVTLQTADGVKVTLMPLESASVKAGAHVDLGQRIGSLAGEGDPSAAASHLHVGVRHGGLYVDPLSALVAPGVPAPQPPGTGHPAVEPQTVTHPATQPVTHPQTAGAPAVPVHAPAAAAAEAPQAHTADLRMPEGREAEVRAPRAVTAPQALRSPVPGTAASAHPAAATASRHAAPEVSGSPSAIVGSLPALLSALRTRDRLAVTVVSYLLATVAAAGSVAAVVRRAAVPASEAPALAPAASDSE